MGDDEQTKTEQDEIIFSARYSVFRVWFMVIVVEMFPTWILCYLLYIDVVKGRNIHAFFVSLLLLLMFLLALDSMSFKELRFYQDRVVKIWHIFGSRTIFYRTAKVIDPPSYLRWLSYAIRETEENGKDLLLQMPVSYVACLFPSDSSKMIGKILDYLTEDTENNPRTFKKVGLPKEVICR